MSRRLIHSNLYFFLLSLWAVHSHWIELNWIELNWIELNWIDLIWFSKVGVVLYCDSFAARPNARTVARCRSLCRWRGHTLHTAPSYANCFFVSSRLWHDDGDEQPSRWCSNDDCNLCVASLSLSLSLKLHFSSVSPCACVCVWIQVKKKNKKERKRNAQCVVISHLFKADSCCCCYNGDRGSGRTDRPCLIVISLLLSANSCCVRSFVHNFSSSSSFFFSLSERASGRSERMSAHLSRRLRRLTLYLCPITYHYDYK